MPQSRFRGDADQPRKKAPSVIHKAQKRIDGRSKTLTTGMNAADTKRECGKYRLRSPWWSAILRTLFPEEEEVQISFTCKSIQVVSS